MLKNKKNFLKYDKKIWNAIKKEKIRQENNIQLIASENYTSNRVMYAQGSCLTNKYAEGYPGKRYYAGCENVDFIEKLAIHRAKKLFSADYANVQPHSGSQANFAVYTALLKQGDTILGMKVSHGGHITHGSSVNLSGKIYKVINYGLNHKEKINYSELYSISKIYKPKMIIGGFSSYSRIINWKKMRKIADEFGCYLLADISHISGLIAAGLYPNPIEYSHVITTTTHKTLAGPRGGIILAKNGNKNMYKKLDEAVFPCTQGGPLMHVIAAKAIALKEAMDPKFIKYQKQVIKNSKYMVSIFLLNKFRIVSGGTDTHLFLIDLSSKNITGKEACNVLNLANIIVNKNLIPNDLLKPYYTSGIRIGTSAITRRGFKKYQVKKISKWICKILNDINNKLLIKLIKNKVINLCYKYPIHINI
ncbi:MAG: serine hydroxymethyltransferase [Candidatus Makana argininalis]